MGVDDGAAIILDNGGDSCKVGFAGDNEPVAVVPSVTAPAGCARVLGGAQPRHRCVLVGRAAQAAMARDDCIRRLSHAVDHGVSTNWDDIEQVWAHAFRAAGAFGQHGGNSMQTCGSWSLPKRLAENHPEGPLQRAVLATEAPFNPLTNREKMVEILFETFSAPSLQIAIPAALALHAAGASTGVVVDSGHGVSYTVPIFESFVVPHGVRRLDLGGRDLTEGLAISFIERQRRRSGASGGNTREAVPLLDAARQAKEELCYVAQDFNAEFASAEEQVQSVQKTVSLPDGASVTIGTERLRCPEALFQPKLLIPSLETLGVQDMAHLSIVSGDIDTRKKLAENVLLVGGSMQFPGMQSRMRKELTRLLRSAMPLKVNVADDPVNAAFLGGSIMASNNFFAWCSLAEYEEFGACKLVRTKCPSLLQASEQLNKN